MSNPSKFGVRGDGDKLTAEFTSGQLVIAICVSLFVALVFFLIGVLVGRYDRPHTMAENPIAAQTAQEAVATGAPEQTGVQTSPNAAAAEPVQRAPWSTGRVRDMEPLPSPTEGATDLGKPVAISKPSPEGEAESLIKSEAMTTAGPSSEGSPDVVAEPAKTGSASTTTAGGAAAPPVSPDQAATPVTPAAKTPAVLEEPDIAMPPITGPVNANGETTAGKTAKPAAGSEKTEPKAAPTGRGKFGIQVASFPGGNRQASAQTYKNQLKSKEGVNAEIVMDGQYARVIITGYKDKASATAACAEFRKKPGLEKSFVRALPQP